MGFTRTKWSRNIQQQPKQIQKQAQTVLQELSGVEIQALYNRITELANKFYKN